jgi:hypothetical protein
MPGINVAALTEGDLRRLLKVAHARADGLLADRLEWEIAARASSVVRPAGPFATLTDDPDEAAEQLAAYDARPFAPEHAARHPVSGRSSGALLVSLGAVAGSLLSATVFWGIERLPTLDGAQPHPTRAMSLRTAPLVQPPPSAGAGGCSSRAAASAGGGGCSYRAAASASAGAGGCADRAGSLAALAEARGGRHPGPETPAPTRSGRKASGAHAAGGREGGLEGAGGTEPAGGCEDAGGAEPARGRENTGGCEESAGKEGVGP